jgi:hypothetical protein
MSVQRLPQALSQLPAGASSSIALTVGVAVAAVPSIINTVSVVTTGDTNAANNSASDPTVVNGLVDLTISKSHTGNFTVGINGVYTLTVTNVGSAATTHTSKNWFFPGNHTFSGDEDFILIVNPSTSSAATVTATFLFENQAPLVQSYPIGPNSRYTIPVHGIVQNMRVSVRLQSTLPVAAERSFFIGSRTGGSVELGAVSSSLTWYFAEGDTSAATSPSAATTLLEMFNPSATGAVVTVNYLLENGTVIARSYNIPAQRRLTVDAATQIGAGLRFSMEVLSTVPIVAERMIFSGVDVGDTVGSPTPAYIWNLAEGFTAFGYETWVVISNPGTTPANVTVRYLLQSGTNVVQTYQLPAKQRLTLYVNGAVPQTSVSTQVTSDQPIVVERTMKFANRSGIHQAMGVRQ